MDISTKRLAIKPLEKSDLETLVSEVNNLNIAKYVVHIPHPYSLEDAKSYYERSLGNEYRNNIYYKGKLIGAIGLNQKEPGILEIGYWIGENHWRQGFATEAVQGMINYLKSNSPDIKKLVANYVFGNEGSGKVLEKCGFKTVGTSEVYMLSQDKNLPTTLVELNL